MFARIPAIVKPQTGKGNQYMALNEEFESRIGKGTKASGKLNFRGPVKIEGEAEGEITGDEVIIATGAVVSARISASKVTIAGAFSGEVTARERVELMAPARVQCTISTPSLVLNEGRQKLYGNVGFRLIEANVQGLIHAPGTDDASWC